MSKTLLPLDSYRLAQYAMQVPCYVCDGPNTFDAELCRHCFAPMALSHQAHSQKMRPQMVAAIGVSGVGKTVYVGMLLDMIARCPQRMQILARGAFSITLQQMATSALRRCQFPQKTPNEPDRWNWVHCQLSAAVQRKPIELIMPDMAGDALLEEVDHPHTYPGIRSFLTKAAGVLILIDATRLESGNREQDYFTVKLLSYLSELSDDAKHGWRTRPISLIFTKGDQCEQCFENPASFAEQYTPSTVQFCQQRFRNFQFFASGVAGACTTRRVASEGVVRVPLRIEPRGILEPFEWLVGKLRP